MDTWKELVKPLALDQLVSVANPPTSGRSGPLQSWARYIQSRPPLVEATIGSDPSLSSSVGMLTCALVEVGPIGLSIGLLNHGSRGRTLAYLWVIGMAVCGDKDMAAPARLWSKNLQVHGRFVSLSFSQ